MNKKKTVYISGHKNPDTDSIASSIAYAELKNRTSEYYAIPIRIGEINKETRFVLDYFDVEAPAYMDTMAPKVVDLDFDRTYGVSKNIPIRKAMELIKENHMNSIPIVDNDEKLTGIVSLSAITKSYTEVWDDKLLYRSKTSLDNIIDVLNGELVFSPKNPRELSGYMKFFSNELGKNNGIDENDIVIIGNKKGEQEDCIKAKVSLLILTNSTDFNENLKELADKNGVTVIKTNNDSFTAARLLPQAIPISYVMQEGQVSYFYLDDYLLDIQEVLKQNRFRTFPVVDHQGKVVGTLSRYHLIGDNKKNLILVDHNEPSQSIRGLEYANILEIIDHHRISAVVTDSPIYFRNMPLGSTATIIGLMYIEKGVSPTKKIAGLICSAIISDTLLFRSPTATKTDEMIVNRFSKIAEIDPEKYALEMFQAGTAIEKSKPTEILKRDVKVYTIKDEIVRIAQVFTMEIGKLTEYKNRLIQRMKELLLDQNEDTYILLMTDIFKEMSEIIIVGKFGNEIAHEFNQELKQNSFIAEKVLSRKKQVIPKVSTAIAKAKED